MGCVQIEQSLAIEAVNCIGSYVVTGCESETFPHLEKVAVLAHDGCNLVDVIGADQVLAFCDTINLQISVTLLVSCEAETTSNHLWTWRTAKKTFERLDELPKERSSSASSGHVHCEYGYRPASVFIAYQFLSYSGILCITYRSNLLSLPSNHRYRGWSPSVCFPIFSISVPIRAMKEITILESRLDANSVHALLADMKLKVGNRPTDTR